MIESIIVTNGKDVKQDVELTNITEENTAMLNHIQVSEAIFTPASQQGTNTNLVEDTNTQILKTNTQMSDTQKFKHEHANFEHEHANMEHEQANVGHANFEHEYAIIKREHESVDNSTIQASQAYFAKIHGLHNKLQAVLGNIRKHSAQ